MLRNINKNAEQCFSLGATHQEQGNFKEAITYYTQAIKLDPKLAKAYHNRGAVYLTQGKYLPLLDFNEEIPAESYQTKAIQDFTKAINLNPKYAMAYTNRGYVYQLKGNLAKAILDYMKSIELDADTIARKNLIHLLAENEKEAIYKSIKKLSQKYDRIFLFKLCLDTNTQLGRRFVMPEFGFFASGDYSEKIRKRLLEKECITAFPTGLFKDDPKNSYLKRKNDPFEDKAYNFNL